jgi:hypothetical protein
MLRAKPTRTGRWEIDSTVMRAHQHAADARRTAPPHLVTDSVLEVVCDAEASTGGAVE